MSQQKKGIPSPAERPDLYDAYDGTPRPAGWKNPVRASSRLERLMAEKQAKAVPAAAPAPKPQKSAAVARKQVGEPA